MKKMLLASVMAVGLTAGAAQAAVIGSTPGGPGQPINNVFGALEGWFGANLYLSAAGPTNATLEFLGHEAGFTNSFNINGGGVEYTTVGLQSNFFPGGTNLLNIVLNPGLLNFIFSANSGATSVANGANITPDVGSPNFFLTLGNGPAFAGDAVVNGSTPSSGNSVIIALDDGGAGPDDNHDDLVVRITLSNGTFNIPEPATLALFGAGLLGLGLARRRRRA